MSGHRPQPDDCECCAWETTALTEVDAYARTRGHGPFTPEDQKVWAWLCKVCRSTPVGNAYLYPDQYSSDVRVLGAAINWGTNAVLNAIDAEAKDRGV